MQKPSGGHHQRGKCLSQGKAAPASPNTLVYISEYDMIWCEISLWSVGSAVPSLVHPQPSLPGEEQWGLDPVSAMPDSDQNTTVPATQFPSQIWNTVPYQRLQRELDVSKGSTGLGNHIMGKAEKTFTGVHASLGADK